MSVRRDTLEEETREEGVPVKSMADQKDRMRE